MTKKILLAMAFVASVFACTDDYKDWADPQVVAQPETVTFGDGSVSAVGVINFADLSADQATVKVCNLTAPTSSNPDYTPFYTITLGDQTFYLNNDGTMSVSELRDYLIAVYGKAPTQRDVQATVDMWISDGATTVKTASSSAFNVSAILTAPFIDEGYWLVGDMAAWGAEGALQFTHLGSGNVYDAPEFQITFATTADNQYWKIIPQNNYDGDFWAGGEKGVLGRAVDGDASMEGNLVTDNAQAGKIEKAGIYRMTINMMEYTYKIEEIAFAPFIYEIGNSHGWSQSMPLYGANVDGKYQGYYYLDGGFKFKPNANNWDGDWGQSKTGATGTLVQDDEQDCWASAGFYQIDVDLAAMTYSLTQVTSISIIGTVNGNWDTDTDLTYNTETGAWEVETHLNAGAMKFRMNHDWAISWGGANDDPKAYDNLTQNKGKDLDVTEAGDYKIQLFITYEGNNRVVITKQ